MIVRNTVKNNIKPIKAIEFSCKGLIHYGCILNNITD